VALLHGGKIKTDDLLFVLRKDTKKYARVEELLYMNEEVKKAKRAFDTEELPANS
jgi:transcription initiation factor TFIID subunit 13